MAFSPITSGQIDRETMETVTDFIWGVGVALKSLQMVTAAAMKIKTLAPSKKSYDQPRQHIKKRDITLPTNVRLVKAVVFLVVMYGYES